MAAPANSPSDSHIQHETPPIFFCWKYWLTTGKVQEGCTPVDASPDGFLDLNDYGWVYMAIPVIGLFLLVFLFYCFCRGKSQNKRQPLMSEESDSEDEEAYRPRARSSAPYRAVPVRNADAKNYYTVVPIDPNDPRKMPLQGGIDPTHPSYRPQQRIYPRLTTMRQQAGLNGRGKGSSNSQPKSVEAPNDYQPDPTSIPHVARGATVPKNAPPSNEGAAEVKDHEDTSSGESDEEQ